VYVCGVRGVCRKPGDVSNCVVVVVGMARSGSDDQIRPEAKVCELCKCV